MKDGEGGGGEGDDEEGRADLVRPEFGVQEEERLGQRRRWSGEVVEVFLEEPRGRRRLGDDVLHLFSGRRYYSLGLFFFFFRTVEVHSPHSACLRDKSRREAFFSL